MKRRNDGGRNHASIPGALLASLAIATGDAQAQQQPAQPRSAELDPVTVSATRIEQRSFDVPVAIDLGRRRRDPRTQARRQPVRVARPGPGHLRPEPTELRTGPAIVLARLRRAGSVRLRGVRLLQDGIRSRRPTARARRACSTSRPPSASRCCAGRSRRCTATRRAASSRCSPVTRRAVRPGARPRAPEAGKLEARRRIRRHDRCRRRPRRRVALRDRRLPRPQPHPARPGQRAAGLGGRPRQQVRAERHAARPARHAGPARAHPPAGRAGPQAGRHRRAGLRHPQERRAPAAGVVLGAAARRKRHVEAARLPRRPAGHPVPRVQRRGGLVVGRRRRPRPRLRRRNLQWTLDGARQRPIRLHGRHRLRPHAGAPARLREQPASPRPAPRRARHRVELRPVRDRRVVVRA